MLSVLDITVVKGEFPGPQQNLKVSVNVGFEEMTLDAPPAELMELGQTQACPTISLCTVKKYTPLRLAS